MPFVYSSQALQRLDRTLTTERLSAYLNACRADRQAAVQLYEYNTLVSEGLYGLIQPLEVALRNSIHHVFQTDLGHNDWYDRITLAAPELRTIAEAKSNILRWGKR